MRKYLPLTALILFFLLVIFWSLSPIALADSSGPNNAATIQNQTISSGIAWNTTTNAKTQNNAYAGAPVGSSSFSYYLEAENFGFAIPAGATINGITADVDRYAENNGCTYLDNIVKIWRSGAATGNDKASGTSWATSDTDTYVTYGGASDLWGLTWTVADVNDTTWGFAMSVKDSGGGLCSVFGDTVHVDHIRVTVAYTAAASAAVKKVTKIITIE